MATNTQHVVPNPNGGWSVKKGGSEKASKTFVRKDDAVVYARRIIHDKNGELVIHRQDGSIQEADSDNREAISVNNR